ncbi:unnamed protein product [Sphacelaria rigidula]
MPIQQVTYPRSKGVRRLVMDVKFEYVDLQPVDFWCGPSSTVRQKSLVSAVLSRKGGVRSASNTAEKTTLVESFVASVSVHVCSIEKGFMCVSCVSCLVFLEKAYCISSFCDESMNQVDFARLDRAVSRQVLNKQKTN